MRVKDLLKFVKESNINENSTWFLDEDREFKGVISFWEYKGNKLFGFAVEPPLSFETTSTVGDCLKIIKHYDIPEDTELWLYVPVSSKTQLITNWKYDGNAGRFSSEILWEKLL